MSHRTPFAGLTAPDANEPISVDGGGFVYTNPDVIDRFLRVGAVTHKHDGHLAITDPQLAPSAAVFASGGSLPAGQDLFVLYTLLDADGGETLPSEAALVTTIAPLENPTDQVQGTFASGTGDLVTGDYYYALTLVDDSGAETGLGPATLVTRPPGFASGSITLTGLDSQLDPDAAVGWRLWRAINGSDFDLIAIGSDPDYTDDGHVIPNADGSQRPPASNVNTNSTNTLVVTLPDGIQEPAVGSAGVTQIGLYISLDGAFLNPCLYEVYPIASAGNQVIVQTLTLSQGAPPDVSTASRGASQIDPDTDLLDWHWKRPVATTADLPAGQAGDARVVISPFGIWGLAADGSDWAEISGGGGGGSIDVTDGNTTVTAASELSFAGADGTVVTVADFGGGMARVTVTASAAGGIAVPLESTLVRGTASAGTIDAVALVAHEEVGDILLKFDAFDGSFLHGGFFQAPPEWQLPHTNEWVGPFRDGGITPGAVFLGGVARAWAPNQGLDLNRLTADKFRDGQIEVLYRFHANAGSTRWANAAVNIGQVGNDAVGLLICHNAEQNNFSINLVRSSSIISGVGGIPHPDMEELAHAVYLGSQAPASGDVRRMLVTRIGNTVQASDFRWPFGQASAETLIASASATIPAADRAFYGMVSPHGEASELNSGLYVIAASGSAVVCEEWNQRGFPRERQLVAQFTRAASGEVSSYVIASDRGSTDGPDWHTAIQPASITLSAHWCEDNGFLKLEGFAVPSDTNATLLATLRNCPTLQGGHIVVTDENGTHQTLDIESTGTDAEITRSTTGTGRINLTGIIVPLLI